MIAMTGAFAPTIDSSVPGRHGCHRQECECQRRGVAEFSTDSEVREISTTTREAERAFHQAVLRHSHSIFAHATHHFKTFVFYFITAFLALSRNQDGPSQSMNVIQRARASGKCPPSLLRDEPKEDAFETAVAKVLDANGGSFVRSQARRS